MQKKANLNANFHAKLSVGGNIFIHKAFYRDRTAWLSKKRARTVIWNGLVDHPLPYLIFIKLSVIRS